MKQAFVTALTRRNVLSGGAGLLGAELALPAHEGLTAREYLFGEAGGFVLTVAPGNLAEAESKLAAAGDWDAFNELTGELVAGKRK